MVYFYFACRSLRSTSLLKHRGAPCAWRAEENLHLSICVNKAAVCCVALSCGLNNRGAGPTCSPFIHRDVIHAAAAAAAATEQIAAIQQGK